MSTTKFPQELLKTRDRTVEELAAGESGYLYFTIGIYVAPDRSVYLEPSARVTETGISDCVRVRRDESGQYHVTVPPKTRMEAKEIKIGPLIPVASITVAETVGD